MTKCIYCGKSPLLTGDFNGICSECRAKGCSEFIAPLQETSITNKTTNKKSFCGNCEEFTTYTTHKELRTYIVLDEMITAEMTIVICDECHKEMYIKEIEMQNDKAFFGKYNELKGKEVIKEIILDTVNEND